jgi:hypothetical protein
MLLRNLSNSNRVTINEKKIYFSWGIFNSHFLLLFNIHQLLSCCVGLFLRCAPFLTDVIIKIPSIHRLKINVRHKKKLICIKMWNWHRFIAKWIFFFFFTHSRFFFAESREQFWCYWYWYLPTVEPKCAPALFSEKVFNFLSFTHTHTCARVFCNFDTFYEKLSCNERILN